MATATSRKSHSVSTGSTEELRARHAALSLAQVRGDVSSETDAELASIEDALAERDAGSHRAERRAEAAKLEESRLADQARADAAEAGRQADEERFAALASFGDALVGDIEAATAELVAAKRNLEEWGTDILTLTRRLAPRSGLSHSSNPAAQIGDWLRVRLDPKYGSANGIHLRRPLADVTSIEHLRRSVETGRAIATRQVAPSAAPAPRPTSPYVGVHTEATWTQAVAMARGKGGGRVERTWEDAVAEAKAAKAARTAGTDHKEENR